MTIQSIELSTSR